VSPLFDVPELVRIAVEDEKTGVLFYSTLAARTRSAPLRQTYQGLADQERRHQKRFEKMLEDLGSYQPTESYPGEYIAYLRAMLDSRAFPDEATGRRMAAECVDDDAALSLAIRFERDTLALYNELRSLVPDKDQATVDELAREEQGHLVELARAQEQLAR